MSATRAIDRDVEIELTVMIRIIQSSHGSPTFPDEKTCKLERFKTFIKYAKHFPAREEKLTPTHTILESNYIKHKTTNQPHRLVRNTNFSNTAD